MASNSKIHNDEKGTKNPSFFKKRKLLLPLLVVNTGSAWRTQLLPVLRIETIFCLAFSGGKPSNRQRNFASKNRHATSTSPQPKVALFSNVLPIVLQHSHIQHLSIVLKTSICERSMRSLTRTDIIADQTKSCCSWKIDKYSKWLHGYLYIM